MPTIVATCIGAGLFGWLLPEFVLILSPQAERFKSVPLMFNVICVAAAILLAYGLRG